ncbi:MAG TPA: helix-turn-helix domain-containing protein [Chitinophagaceae bacterium]|nr:helix-turn-helix domain-containing protein [Chitinophagaceae bacterium]
MDIKRQAIHEYLHEGKGYRTLAKKYGVSRTTINKWVMILPYPQCLLKGTLRHST